MKPEGMEKTFHSVHEHENRKRDEAPDIRPRKLQNSISCFDGVPHDQSEKDLRELTVREW